MIISLSSGSLTKQRSSHDMSCLFACTGPHLALYCIVSGIFMSDVDLHNSQETVGILVCIPGVYRITDL